MEIEFLEDPSYAIREKEMQIIHEVLSKNVAYEPKAIFLRKLVRALIDASKNLPRTKEFEIPQTHMTPHVSLEVEHREFPTAKTLKQAEPYIKQVGVHVKEPTPRIVVQKPIAPQILRSPVLLEKIRQRQRQAISPTIQKPKAPSLEEGIPIPTPKGSLKTKEMPLEPQVIKTPQIRVLRQIPKVAQVPRQLEVTRPPEVQKAAAAPLPETLEPARPIAKTPREFDSLEFPSPPKVMATQSIDQSMFVDITPPSPPKLEGLGRQALREEIKPKVRIEQIPKAVQAKPTAPEFKHEEINVEKIPEIDTGEDILKIKSVPEEERKYMPPIHPALKPTVTQEPIKTPPEVAPVIPVIQPTLTKAPEQQEKSTFEVEHAPEQTEYKELEPIERRFIPLHQEIELNATPIQKKAQSIMPPPPKPVGGQVSHSEPTGVSFLELNPRSGVREMEGNILYEVADPFSSPLQEVFEFIRLNVFVNPNKINDSRFLDESFRKMSKQLNISIEDKDKKTIVAKVNEYINGFGKIKDMISDPSISAIYCNGLNRPIIVDFKLIGKISTNVVYQDRFELERIIKNMARMSAREISEANPLLDATISGNIKIEATLGGDFISSKFVIKKM